MDESQRRRRVVQCQVATLPLPRPRPAVLTPKKSSPAQPIANRRSGRDRRQKEAGPPSGQRERRVGIEPRQPEVQEVDPTDSAWAELQDLLPPPRR